MTRASLLHILDHVSRISEAEIRELEQLATAFPYCQTAHVLLAKAAHDRGSMLASQRLRRAATYAADRELLRRLLEQPAPEPVVLPEIPAPKAIQAGSSTAFFQTLGPEDVQPLESTETEPAPPNAAPVSADATPIEWQPEAAPATEALEYVALEEAAPEVAVTNASETDSIAAVEAPEAASDVAPNTDVSVSAAVVPETASTERPAFQPTSSDTAPDDVLPAAAPPIRPPAEAGSSRFEFGLGVANALTPSALYQLPDVGPNENDDKAPPVAQEAIPDFHADAVLAYALLGGGSRLGYALQLQANELTVALPRDEFFAPDALLHEYGLTYRPKAAPSPSSLDLIDRFLKNQPRLKSPAVRLSLAEEQTDLSVRSTSVVPQLASESLAKIMVRQGKRDKAIEIYERLMVRQPEKSAYFADQIQQLQTPE